MTQQIQQIQHRMSNPASPWVAVGLVAVVGFVGYYYWMENEKKKKEGEAESREAVVIPASAWAVDPNEVPVPNEVEAGQLYKAVFTLPLVDGAVPEYEIAYLPEGAFEVLEILTQEIQDENEAPVGVQGTITFIPKVVAETQGIASIVVGNDNLFRGLTLNISE